MTPMTAQLQNTDSMKTTNDLRGAAFEFWAKSQRYYSADVEGQTVALLPIQVASRRQPPAPHRWERSTLLMMSAIVLFYCHCSLLLPSLRDKNPCAAATV